ncbi:MAG: DUF5615 family PIN-like protein [Bacteroidia bacterium]
MLLLDENLSFRLLKKIEAVFPYSEHVTRCGLPFPVKDYEIWNYARQNNLIVVTFDEDFSDLLSLNGSPPKVIWLRTGNLPTSVIAAKLLASSELILSLSSDIETDIIEIY